MKLNTILKIILKNVEHWFLKAIGKRESIVPYKLLLQTTDDCNSKCENCHIWKINKNGGPGVKLSEINMEDAAKIFKDLNKNLIWLALSGGEVTLKSETIEIVRLAKKYCKNLAFVTFTTNGLIPVRALELSRGIKELDLDCFVTISMDGEEELHDELRGVPGNFKKIIETRKLISNIGVSNHFGITLSNRNHDFIKKSYDKYEKELRSITFVHSNGIYNKLQSNNYQKICNSLKIIYKAYKIRSVSDIVEKIYIKLGIIFIEKGRKENVIQCDSGYSSLHIFPKGGVSPCMFLSSAGNIKKQSLKNIMGSTSFLNLRKRAREGDCEKCWMNCYAPHSMMQHPLKSLWYFLKG